MWSEHIEGLHKIYGERAGFPATPALPNPHARQVP